MSYEFDDIAQMIRDEIMAQIHGTINDADRDDLQSQVEDALSALDVPTRDDVLSHDDVNEAIYEIINSGNIDVTDMVDADQIADSLSYSYTMKGAVEDWITESDEFTDLVERVNDLLQQVGTEEPNGLADRVYDLEKWTQEREEGTPEENEGYNALVNEVKNITERIVYMEGIINSFVDWADSLGDKGNAALTAIVADDSDTAPYAAI